MQQPVNRSRIIIVDDDLNICRNLKAVLELEGYTVEAVSNGEAALISLAAGFDMMIADLSMPDMDGLTLLKRCREAGYHLTTIMMTGYASVETVVEALQLGAYDYVLKPFDPAIVLAAVARAAERLQLRRELDLRKHLEMVTRMALTVRHEINNPLAAIMGLAQLHLDEPLPDDMRQDLETIAKSAQRISDSLQQLTQLRRLILTDTGIGDGSQIVSLDESRTSE